MGFYLHSPKTTSWHGAQLNHRDNFTFTLPPAWRLGEGLTTPHHTETSSLRNFIRCLVIGELLWTR